VTLTTEHLKPNDSDVAPEASSRKKVSSQPPKKSHGRSHPSSKQHDGGSVVMNGGPGGVFLSPGGCQEDKGESTVQLSSSSDVLPSSPSQSTLLFKDKGESTVQLSSSSDVLPSSPSQSTLLFKDFNEVN